MKKNDITASTHHNRYDPVNSSVQTKVCVTLPNKHQNPMVFGYSCWRFIWQCKPASRHSMTYC